MQYVEGDATAPIGEGPKIIAHICNDVGGWGAGFVLAISSRWREPERAYRAWFDGRVTNDFELGAVSLAECEPDVWVANIIGQRDLVDGPDGPPIRYEAALGQLAGEAYAMAASVHMPRIGCGLAGGEWSAIEAIIDRTLSAAGIPTTVYDFSAGE